MGIDNTQNENGQKIKAEFADGEEDKPRLKVTTWLPNGKDNEAAAIEYPDLNHNLRFDVKPSEAIDYFDRKKIVTKPEFNKLEREAKAGAFAVSGVYRADVLEAFRFEITDALESGRTQRDLTKQFKEILAGKGHQELGDWHLENIARTNMQMAYGVGRRRAMEDVADDLPYWEYSAVMDDRTRPTHRALHGLIFEHDDPFWDEHFPPWDFLCRCTVISRLDLPDDYNPEKPNADSRIIYDDDGLPAKAEWQTQVLDLQATNFVGVPKITKLDEVLESAAQKMKSTRILNHQNIPQVVVDEAKRIRLKQKENLIGWGKNGEKIGEYIGEPDKVGYPASVEGRLKDGFDIHNHPPEGKRKNRGYFESFSDKDFYGMLRLDIKAMYAVTRKHLYQLRRPGKGFTPDMEKRFIESFDKHYDKIALKMQSRLRSGELSIEEIYDLENHLIWKEVAKELKMKYKRFKVSEL